MQNLHAQQSREHFLQTQAKINDNKVIGQVIKISNRLFRFHISKGITKLLSSI